MEIKNKNFFLKKGTIISKKLGRIQRAAMDWHSCPEEK